MTASLRNFERALDRFTQETLPARVGALQQAIAREALRGLVLRTPVRTGRTRGNWQVGLDAPPEGSVAENDPSGTTTIARGERVIDQARPDQTLWIVNNEPGVEALERGDAEHAPLGMVAATVASLRARFRGGA